MRIKRWKIKKQEQRTRGGSSSDISKNKIKTVLLNVGKNKEKDKKEEKREKKLNIKVQSHAKPRN